MKIAFTSKGTNWDSIIDSRFGRTEFFVIFNEETNQISSVDNSDVKNEAHGAGTAAAQKIFEIKPDVLITGNGPGENAATVLRQLKMSIFIDAHNMSVKEAYESYKSGILKAL
ncbi:MAG: dinitrogenase iron-molybdenum cofactor biosynthesis protein [Bacteroidales bacterium]|nr:dinitrogenase iron-molybdenum cofactor biosynthesis protein [Bacteroidales bacterium]